MPSTLTRLPKTGTRQSRTLRAIARNSARGRYTTATGAGITPSQFLDDLRRLRDKGFELEFQGKGSNRKFRLTNRSQISQAKNA